MRIDSQVFAEMTGGSCDGSIRLDYTPIADQQGTMAEVQALMRQGFPVPNWDDAWAGTLRRFEGSGYKLDALNPLFVGSSTVHRFRGQYIEGIDHFERRFNEVLRDWIFRTFLGEVPRLLEFGAGSCINAASYARMFPDKPVVALDFAPSAVRIANLLGEHCGMKIEGADFDFISPDPAIDVKDAGVLTWCALEQMGHRFGAFLDFLLSGRPRRIVHVEPIVEWYTDTPFDRMATEYHLLRRYLIGLWPVLRRLQRTGDVKIVYRRRTGFGSRFHEGYSIIVWEPA